MDWLSKLEHLSYRQLKHLAFLSGGMAVLMLAALSVSGAMPMPLVPEYLTSLFNQGANTAGVATWTQQTGSGLHRWNALAASADGKRILAASIRLNNNTNTGYLYVSSDSGATWTQQTSLGEHYWRAVAASANGMTLVATEYSDDKSVYVSLDGGENWERHGGGHSWIGITASADGKKLAAIATDNINSYPYVFTSTDGADSWTQNTVPITGLPAAVKSSADGNTIAVAISNTIYVSTNGGTSWSSTSGLPNQVWSTMALSADGRTLLATYDNATSLYVSTNNGASWTTKALPAADGWIGMSASANATRLAIVSWESAAGVAGAGSIYTSSDSGTTWVKQTAAGAKDWFFVVSSSDGTKLAAIPSVNNTTGYVYTTTLAGACNLVITRQTSAGSLAWKDITSSFDGTKLAATSFTNGVYTSQDSGVTWSLSKSGTNFSEIVSSLDGTRLAALSTSLFTSTNSGSSWVQQTTPTTFQLLASSADGMILVAAPGILSTGSIYVSYDGGATWNQTASGSYRWQAVAVSSDGLTIAGVETTGSGQAAPGYIWVSSDGGATWTQGTGTSARMWADISTTDGKKFIAVATHPDLNSGDPDYVYTSSDAGATWTQQTAMGSALWYRVTGSPTLSSIVATPYSLSSSVNYFYRSTNGGVSAVAQTGSNIEQWKSLTSSVDGSKLAAIGGVNDAIYTAVCNYAPDAPSVMAANTTSVGTQINVTASSTDIEGEQVRFGIDWDNNGSADEWTGYVASGVDKVTPHTWNTAGTQPYGVVAQDASGYSSATTTKSISVTSSGSPTGSITGQTDCSIAVGTACDPDGPSSVVSVGLYRDGGWSTGGGVLVATTTTTNNTSSCSTGHTFSYPSSGTLPSPYQDGTQHTIYAYAKNMGSGKDAFLGSLSCTKPPSVTITIGSDAREATSPTNGSFTVTRAGLTTSSLTVNFTTDGTAAPGGVDFQDFGTSVVIPAGQASVTTTVQPRNNNSTANGTKTLVINLSSSASYALGSPSTGTINITDDDSAPPSSISFYANKVRKGSNATLTWSIVGMSAGITCEITPPVTMPAWSGFSPWTGSVTTGAINTATKYTLACGNGVATTSKATTASLVPVPTEI